MFIEQDIQQGFVPFQSREPSNTKRMDAGNRRHIFNCW